MRVAAIQCPVFMDPAANLQGLSDALRLLAPQTFAVAPEGVLSGYLPEAGFVGRLDERATAHAIEIAREIAIAKQLHLIAGACVRIEGTWRNASYYFGPSGQSWRYDKVNLAWNERSDFKAGSSLPILDIEIGGENVRIGVQMCREIRYPEQWRYLADQGAKVIAYVNNAVNSTIGHEVWRSHTISRAAETQRFVVGANNAGRDPLCPSMIVAPDGRVLAEAQVGATVAISEQVDVSTVSDWIISQSRSDVLRR